MSDENSPSKSFSIPEFRQSEASIAQKANVAEQMATQRSNEQVMRTERIGNNSVLPGGTVPADPTDARWEAQRQAVESRLPQNVAPSNSCSARLPSPWKEIP